MDIMNIIENIKNGLGIKKGLKPMMLLFVIFLILLFCVMVSNKFGKPNSVEGYSTDPLYQQNYFELKRDDDAYDAVYAKYYDTIHLDKAKYDYEIGKIGPLLANSSAFVLDVGCGTGYHANKMRTDFKKATVVGLDKSSDMLDKAKTNYPKCEFMQGDILDNKLDLDNYTHITCLNNTIYGLDNTQKARFFENCYSILRDNGVLVLHLVDPDKFKPFSQSSASKEVYNPEKYGKPADSLIVKFSDSIEYISKYEVLKETTENKPYAVYKEKIENFDKNSVWKNEINMYLLPIKDIVVMANAKGFELHEKISLGPEYPNEYLFFFAPSHFWSEW